MKLLYQLKSTKLFLAIGFLSSLLIGCSLFPVFITSDVPIFQISEWKSDSYPEFVIRLDDTINEEGLLFKNDPIRNPGTYRYLPKTASLSLVNDKFWEQSSGVIVRCLQKYYLFDLKNPKDDHQHVLNEKKHKVKGQHQITTAGEYLMLALINSDKTKAAILSVDGPEHHLYGFVFFFSLINWMEGQQYHQFFSLISNQPIGEPIRLPFQQKAPSEWTIMCWSPDEKYVIYSDSDFRLVIIPVPSGNV